MQKDISVIIPTLNESSYLGKTIENVYLQASDPSQIEVIVVDTGSTDDTQKIAKKFNAELIEIKPNKRGRATALNQGVKQASSEVFLFLDADSQVPSGFDLEIHKALKNSFIGGAFEFALDGQQISLRLVECVNRIRYRIWPYYYGDQGIFVARQAFEKVGGYPEVGIMEASRFCQNLLKLGKLKLITKEMKTSPRRFLEGGVIRVLLHDVKIWWRDFRGDSTEEFAADYWHSNESRKRTTVVSS